MTIQIGRWELPRKVLSQEAERVIVSTNNAIDNADIYKNVVDPFAAVIEANIYNESIVEWESREKSRQINKTLTTTLGSFHQTLMGHLPGWDDRGSQGGVFDLIHHEPFGPQQKPVFAEVKNKFNTMNSNNQGKLFSDFENQLRYPEYNGYIGYLIQIIPPKNYEKEEPWAPGRRGKREDIRLISAADVYSFSTNEPNALFYLYRELVKVLKSMRGDWDPVDISIADAYFRTACLRPYTPMD